jgi:putative ABC transport system substrate-binding protein
MISPLSATWRGTRVPDCNERTTIRIVEIFRDLDECRRGMRTFGRALMKRREFLWALGGAAASSVSWPLTLRAQQPAMPVIGFLSGRSAVQSDEVVGAFRQGLGEIGFVEGRNVAIEYRWAENQYDRLPMLAADLVRQNVAVIAAVAGHLPALAAKSATSTIPIVFESGNDPVKFGLVGSLSRPEGNVTGVSMMASLLASKQLALLHELAPKVRVIGVLLNSANPNASAYGEDLQSAATALAVRIEAVTASTAPEIDTAFANLVRQGGGALLVGNDPLFGSQREKLATLALRHALPAMSYRREFAEAGGLLSYGADFPDGYRQVGVYVGKILKGVKTIDLPVMQPTKFQLVINLKTAKALGLAVPPMLLATADEVIE